MSGTKKLQPIDIAKLIGLTNILKASEGLKPQDIYGNLKPKRLESGKFDSLIRAQTFDKPEEYESLFRWAFSYIKEHKSFVESNIDLWPLLANLFDGKMGCTFIAPADEMVAERIKLHERIASYFLQYAEEKAPEDKKTLHNYEGTYQVVRYATSSDQHPDPRVIVACATIVGVERPKVFPEFTLYFPQRRKVPVKDLPTTKGVLIPLDKHVFMVGQDKESDYPAIVVFPYQKNQVHSMNGLVLRRHVEGHIIAARCHFVKHSQETSGKSIDHILEEVSIYPEDCDFVHEEIDEVLQFILNKVPLVGKGTLRLVP